MPYKNNKVYRIK